MIRLVNQKDKRLELQQEEEEAVRELSEEGDYYNYIVPCETLKLNKFLKKFLLVFHYLIPRAFTAFL
jgi:hypothetical protein